MPTDQEDRELLIRLEGKIDGILKTLDCISPLEERIRRVEISTSSTDSKVSTLAKDIEDLENKSDTWSILNSLGVGVAAVLSLIFK